MVGGVQIFSLLSVNPKILHLLMDIFNSARSLGDYLSNNTSILEYVLNRDFYFALPKKSYLKVELEKKIKGSSNYEDVLNVTRSWAKENQFRTSIHLLKGFSSTEDISKSFSNIAEVCLVCLFPKVLEHFAIRYGSIVGMGSTIISMGKLGSQEMSFSSDLDLILIYDIKDGAYSNGKVKLPAKLYFSRFTQALISALTVPTAEGNLFNVDMRLRPSGQKGPVATSIKSFEAYQKNDAWVWETLALSRGRVIAGNAELRKKLKIIIQEILKKESIHKQVVKQVEKMRTSLSLKNSNSKNFLGVKDGPGNLMDLELLIQMGCLLTRRFDYQSPYKMLKILKQVGFFTVDDIKELITLQSCPICRKFRTFEEAKFNERYINFKYQFIDLIKYYSKNLNYGNTKDYNCLNCNDNIIQKSNKVIPQCNKCNLFNMMEIP